MLRHSPPQTQAAFRSAVLALQVYGTPVASLELLHHELKGFALLRDQLARLPQARLSANAGDRAVWAMCALQQKGNEGYHRVKAGDALIAAAAEEHGLPLLHYDKHIARLAEVLSFKHVWLAPAGSLAGPASP